MSVDPLPVIDVAPLAGADDEGVTEVGRMIHAACTGSGFFYVEGHGVDAELIGAAMDASLAFFRLPDADKRRTAVNRYHRGFNALGDALMRGATRPDYKEFFQIGLELAEDDPDVAAGQALRGPNQWPDEPAAFRPAMSAYFESVAACGARLLRGVAAGLGVDPAFFEKHYAKPLQRTQAVYYPPQPESLGPDQFGVAPHSDFGCITLLVQDARGGLEVQGRNGEWIAAPPIPGTFVVNVGDLLERWTNERFRSTRHRVINRSGRERLSIATFYDPTFTAVVDPRDLGLAGGEAPRPAPIGAGEHILSRINASFGYRGHD